MANYLKQGTNDNFIIDSAEIELAKFNNLRFSVLGYMLGDFDEHGVYTVDEEIVKELIAMRKYIVSTIDNVEICHSEIRLNRPVTFLVTFEEDCATLSLIEKISHEGNYKENGGSVSDINEYVLDRVETSGIINRSAVYRRWHIGEFAGNARDIASLDDETKAEFFGLINRFKYLLYTNTLMLEKEEEIEEQEVNYAEEMKKLIARFPKLKAAVDKDVKEKLTVKKDFVRIDKPFVARTINEIVEQAIAENISVLKPKELEAFKAEKHEILNQHNQRMAQIIQTRVEKPVRNTENSVGKVVVDTGVMPVAVLPKVSVEIVEGQEVGTPVVAAEHPEKRHTIEDLRKGLNTQRVKTENRLIDEAVNAITGQAPTDGTGAKPPKTKRITDVVDHDMNTHVSATTKREAEDGKRRRPVDKSATDKNNKGLIAKATEKPKTATAEKPKAPAKTAGGGGKSAGGGGKSAGGKSKGGGGDSAAPAATSPAPAKNKTEDNTTKRYNVDPRFNDRKRTATKTTTDEEDKVVEEKPKKKPKVKPVGGEDEVPVDKKIGAEYMDLSSFRTQRNVIGEKITELTGETATDIKFETSDAGSGKKAKAKSVPPRGRVKAELTEPEGVDSEDNAEVLIRS